MNAFENNWTMNNWLLGPDSRNGWAVKKAKRAGKFFLALTFLLLFASRQKEERKESVKHSFTNLKQVSVATRTKQTIPLGRLRCFQTRDTSLTPGRVNRKQQYPKPDA